MRLSFNDIFKFDIAQIDNGHERIVLMLNEIGDSLDKQSCDCAWRQIIHLIAVERKHAHYETELLRRHNYTEVDGHSRYHDRLNEALNALMDAISEKDGEQARKLHQELCVLFLDDILKADLPFKSLAQNVILNR